MLTLDRDLPRAMSPGAKQPRQHADQWQKDDEHQGHQLGAPPVANDQVDRAGHQLRDADQDHQE